MSLIVEYLRALVDSEKMPCGLNMKSSCLIKVGIQGEDCNLYRKLIIKYKLVGCPEIVFYNLESFIAPFQEHAVDNL